MKARGYAAQSAGAALADFPFERRNAGPGDVVIDILYCGVCHSDIHFVNNDWGRSRYPLVPGHEIVGRVTAVGESVSRFKVGDYAGIGCFVDSCRQCDPCHQGEEHFCVEGMTSTYGGLERGTTTPTYGGYSNNYVVNEAYALKIAPELDLAATAPLLCAGITTWSPLRHWKVGPGQKVGVVGLGGLGHMAVKFAKAFGAQVVMITRSESKAADAERLGADYVLLSTDPAAVKSWRGKLDFILDTVAAPHNMDDNLILLKTDGVCCLVGLPETPLAFNAFQTARRKVITGSFIGGIRETQDMLDFCAKHNIVSDIELIDIQSVNEAYERVLNSDVKYRFVIDMASLEK